MQVGIIRYSTALLVIAFCVWEGSRGYQIVSFNLATEDGAGSDKGNIDAARPWISSNGLAFAARAASLRKPAAGDFQALVKHRDGLADMLTVKPLASSVWLSLAMARAATGQPPDKIATALVFSEVTGPNEGTIMAQRAIFAISRWEVLPQELRIRAADDVTWGYFQWQDNVALRMLLE